jgi:hypothetical protein
LFPEIPLAVFPNISRLKQRRLNEAQPPTARGPAATPGSQAGQLRSVGYRHSNFTSASLKLAQLIHSGVVRIRLTPPFSHLTKGSAKWRCSTSLLLLVFCTGCTHLQQEQCGDLRIWRYGFHNAGLPGAQFERTELSFLLKAGTRKSFNLEPCAESVPLPNLLVLRLPNIRDVVAPTELGGHDYKCKIVDLARPLPYSNVIIRLKAILKHEVVAENRIDFSESDWYLAVVDNHQDGIAARKLFPRAIQYDELQIEIVAGLESETDNTTAVALFSSENRNEVEQMAQLGDGRRALLQTLPESYLLDFKDRPRRWPPRWLKLDPAKPEGGKAPKELNGPVVNENSKGIFRKLSATYR